MTTVTIPEKLTSGDLIAIPKKEYEEFLAIRKFIKVVPAYKEEKHLIKKKQQEIKEGKYREWQVIKNELARRTN